MLSASALQRCNTSKDSAARGDQTDCEKFPIVYFLNCSRRPRSLDQRGFRNGADAQIGGGVRVGDAFQAIVGPRLMATWATESCVSISRTLGASRLVGRARGIDFSHSMRGGAGSCERVRWIAGERSGVAAERNGSDVVDLGADVKRTTCREQFRQGRGGLCNDLH